MNKFQTFQEFLATQSVQVPVVGFLINMLLAAALSFLLARVYVNYGTSLSNRRMFAKNFMLVTMTTMLVITIVKSSLALSLGLVGALSIVRFRAAIKEPEELSFLFLAIALGLGFGADQRVITTVAFMVICGFIVLRKRQVTAGDHQNLYLAVTSNNPKKLSLEQISDVLKKHCSALDVKRFDETKDVLEASFLIEFDNYKNLEGLKTELQGLNNSVKITFLDNKGGL
jgi:uncharacterized membrane protein YhiD involved in acid resistance|tara:strand:+ start:1431 stop:2114 length:684 start_codon:yes stop_codon:yes gene_type:complete